MPSFLSRAGAVVGMACWVALAGGCAVREDRTAELLSLDLVDRADAVARLQAEDRTEPTAWRAFTLGSLQAEAGDYAAMTTWFATCLERDPGFAPDVEAVRSRHWKRWAEEADAAFAAGHWADAERLCTVALTVDAHHDDTVLRRHEAAVMAHGPTPAGVAALTAADRTAAVDRWLEHALGGGVTADARARVAAGLAVDPVFPMGAFALGELARAAGDDAAMGRWYDRTQGLLDAHHRDVMAANRQSAQVRFVNAALAAWAAGDQAGALAAFGAAEAVRPGAADVAALRARAVALDAARGEAAVTAALEHPDLDDAWLEAWLVRLHAAGRTDDAVLVADRLLQPVRRAAPDVVRRARRVRASCLAARGQWDAAAHDLRLLLDPPSGDRAVDATTAIALGDVLMSNSRWNDAIPWYASAEQWGGETAALHKRQARAAFGAGRIAEFERHARAALVLAPGDAEAQDMVNQAGLLPELAAAGRRP